MGFWKEAKELERMDYLEFIAFITNFGAVDRIIDHLKLTFIADKPPPSRIAYQEVLMAAEAGSEYFS